MIYFLETVAASLVRRRGESAGLNEFDDIFISSKECFFIFDLTLNQVSHHKGFDTAFGYEIDDLNLDFLMDKDHPEDADVISKLVKCSISQIMDKPIPKYTNLFNLSFRFRVPNGQYLRVLSNTYIFDTNIEGKVKSVMVKYTDVSFLQRPVGVEWWINEQYLDKEVINKEVYGNLDKFFTQREKDIISKMFKGESTRSIAHILNISAHTVATHRRNIFYKTNCHDVVELKKFCGKNGISNLI